MIQIETCSTHSFNRETYSGLYPSVPRRLRHLFNFPRFSLYIISEIRLRTPYSRFTACVSLLRERPEDSKYLYLDLIHAAVALIAVLRGRPCGFDDDAWLGSPDP